MKITIQTIPHLSQRYDTCGDWIFDEYGDLNVFVSDLGDWKMEYLIGSHEVREALLCKDMGISQKAVDDFDMGFKGEGEPGDSEEAPYKNQHFYATTVERLDSGAFNVNWKDYETKINSLIWPH